MMAGHVVPLENSAAAFELVVCVRVVAVVASPRDASRSRWHRTPMVEGIGRGVC
jgi:hypothetical protein